MGLKRASKPTGRPAKAHLFGLHDLDDDSDDAGSCTELSELKPSGFLADIGPRQKRRLLRQCSRSAIRAYLKRAMIVVPCLALMLLGAVHALQVLIGRSRLIWNSLPDQAFPPSFGRLSYNRAPVLAPEHDDVVAIPIPCHSHNDYWRSHPLFDAIAVGCTGVEADVWLFDDQLFVGHSVQSLKRSLTFTRLYVDPLVELLDSKLPELVGDALTIPQPSIFERDANQTLVLLVDLKTSGIDTLKQVQSEIKPLRERGYLTYFDGEKRVHGPVTVVATGYAPFHSIALNDTYRDIFFDAPLDQLWQEPRTSPVSDDEGAAAMLDYGDAMAAIEETASDHVGPDIVAGETFNATNSYYASVSFRSAVGHIWRGHLSQRQMRIVRGHIRGARLKGLKLRYWDTPAWPLSLRNHVWHVLMKEGASVLSVDDIKGCAMANWQARFYEWW